MVKKWNPAYEKTKGAAGTPGKVAVNWYDYHDNDYAYTDRQTPHFLSFQKIANQELVDDSRDWKTKYYNDRGFQHNLAYGNNMSKDKRYFTGHSRTPWVDDDGDRRPSSYGWSGKQWEILDFDAYNRDALYKNALNKRHGRTQFNTPQDILDAEEVMSGNWSSPKKIVPQPSDPEPPKPEVFKDVLGNPVTEKVKDVLGNPVTEKEIITKPIIKSIQLDDLVSDGPIKPETVGPDTDRWGKPKGTVYFDRRHEDPDRWERGPSRPSPPTTQQQIGYDDFASWMNQYNTANPQPQQLGYNDFSGWMNQYNTANPQPQRLGYNDFSGWMQQYNTANPVAPPPPPKDTFGDFMGYMKQYNMMSGPQQQAPQFGYGVGGTASGGVAAANPYQNFANYMEQFQAPSNASPVTSSLLNI